MTGAKPAPCAQGPQSGGELHGTRTPRSETWIRNPETSSYKPSQKQGVNVGAAARHRPGSGSCSTLSRELRSGATTRSKHKLRKSCRPVKSFTSAPPAPSETWARTGVCSLWALGQWRPVWRMSYWLQLGSASLCSFPKAMCPHLLSQKCFLSGVDFVETAMGHPAEQWEEQRNAASSKNIHISYTSSLLFCTYCSVWD